MNYFLNNFPEWRKKNIRKSMTLEPSYFYWCNTLLEYTIHLFTWNGLPETIPSHEIEMACICNGYGSIVRLSNDTWVAPFENNRVGITDYYDMFTSVNFTTPLHYGKRTIGKDAILIANTSLKMPLLPKIQRYATLLAHTDVSICCELVNDRETKLFQAINGKSADKCNLYQSRLYNGEFETIVNSGLETITVTELNKRSQGEIEKLLVVRSKLLQAFFEEIGLKKSSEKKERMITDETIANDDLLKYSINDMFISRQKAADEMRALCGWDVNVKCNVVFTQNENLGGGDDGENSQID